MAALILLLLGSSLSVILLSPGGLDPVPTGWGPRALMARPGHWLGILRKPKGVAPEFSIAETVSALAFAGLGLCGGAILITTSLREFPPSGYLAFVLVPTLDYLVFRGAMRSLPEGYRAALYQSETGTRCTPRWLDWAVHGTFLALIGMTLLAHSRYLLEPLGVVFGSLEGAQ